MTKKLPSYQRYVEAYREKANQLARKGYSMYDQLYSAEEFQIQYQSLRNEYQQQVRAGERKGVGNVLRDLVNDQTYRFSKKQATLQKVAAEKFGYKAKLRDLMAGDEKLGEILKAQRQLLKDQGYSNKEVNLIISQEYFGSD